MSVINVVLQKGEDQVQIKAKPSTKICKLINAFAANKNINASDIRLINDTGKRFSSTCEDTLADLGVEDGDSFDVVLEQVGGAVLFR
mmetsp:Transcript_3733/g.10238  ORF Transcript_3733/g.10238 Transcript_3733/m.10238 type:complete len:87 (+) Transcript_3733:77-337(+)|eukprot:CAMPEP_0119129256 /NCGR_PEP_ID=MMETSP1310-20130426/7087_1 /TAXON_ID=464262 /ORGANISM="Genus nov. species nov., Strain RCC2339" /LENGTH=86 /DNA_ID=CAMNT_0007119673 /DNA_START=77 /DNA_END=337 /DNA_ORIENTATION=-